MSRTNTPRRRRPSRTVRAERIMRRLAIAGAVPVGAVALWVSYGHIHDVTLAAGESPTTARIMALSVDGLMVTAAVAIMSGRRSLLPYLAFVAGLAASLGANVLSASGSPVSYVVAGWPALALTLTSELLLRLLVPARAKPRRRTRSTPARSRTAKATTKSAPVRKLHPVAA